MSFVCVQSINESSPLLSGRRRSVVVGFVVASASALVGEVGMYMVDLELSGHQNSSRMHDGKVLVAFA